VESKTDDPTTGSCIIVVKTSDNIIYNVHLSSADCPKVQYCCTVYVSGTETSPGVIENAAIRVISCVGGEISITGHVDDKIVEDDGTCTIVVTTSNSQTYTVSLSISQCLEVVPCNTVILTGTETQTGHIGEVTSLQVLSQGCTVSNVLVSNITSVSAVISWMTDVPSIGTIRYGTDSTMATYDIAYDQRGEDYSGLNHYVLLSGLQSNTRYYFEIVTSCGLEGDINYFSTTSIGTVPIPYTIYGEVLQSDGASPADGAVVFVSLTHDGTQSRTLSALVDQTGYYTMNIAAAMDANGTYIQVTADDVIAIDVDGGDMGTASATPSPLVTLTNPQLISTLTLNIGGGTGTISASINLISGFNLIALPVYPVTDEIGNPISLTGKDLIAMIPGCRQIFSWDETTQAWITVINTGTIVIGADFPVEVDKGYMVQADSATTLTLTGYEISAPVALNLVTGFNLCRFYESPTISHTSFSILDSIDNSKQVFGWSTVIQAWKTAIDIGTINIGEDFAIEFDKGYFVQTTGSAVWP